MIDASARHPKNWPLQVPVKECRNRTRSLGEVFRRVNAGPFGAIALLVVCTKKIRPRVVMKALTEIFTINGELETDV
jgi:hypothetical protein